MRSMPVFVIAVCFFIFPGVLFCETGVWVKNSSDNIGKVDSLADEFQRQGPWSRRSQNSESVSGALQPNEYLAVPDSQLPPKEAENSTLEYPLCYNPYTGVYEYCAPRGSSNFRLRFSSPDFRFWWKRGRTCPPGYYFSSEGGCYRR